MSGCPASNFSSGCCIPACPCDRQCRGKSLFHGFFEMLEQPHAAQVESHHGLVIAVQGMAQWIGAIGFTIELLNILIWIIVFHLLPQVSRLQSFHLLGHVINPPAMRKNSSFGKDYYNCKRET